MLKSPRASMPAPTGRPSILLPVISAAFVATALTACSSTPSRFQSGRSYGLTGGTETMRQMPPDSLYSGGPAAAPSAHSARGDDPHANAVYRGGRDPVTGKAPAPAWGGAQPQSAPQPYAPAQPRADIGRGAVRPQVAGHTVVEVGEGDTLYGLSTKYRVSMNSIMTANGLNDPTLIPGQKVVIPAR